MFASHTKPLQGELKLASAETAASHSPPRLSVIQSALPALCELARCSDLYLVTQVMIPHHSKRVLCSPRRVSDSKQKNSATITRCADVEEIHVVLQVSSDAGEEAVRRALSDAGIIDSGLNPHVSS